MKHERVVNVCFKKTVTIHSSDIVLWIVTVFLKQTALVSMSRMLLSSNMHIVS